jgi:dolichol-phosphate mannosyltransferase
MSFVSIVIPAKNEAEQIGPALETLQQVFRKNNLNYEIIVVNDGSSDHTAEIVRQYGQQDSRIRSVDNDLPHGFGNAIRKGLDVFRGDMVIMTMADRSDDPEDIVRFVRKIQEGYDCCFGSRWNRGAKVVGYPVHKFILNRLGNWFISLLFGIGYTDVTNAFKCYSRETIEGIKPIFSRHFNITVELPLKAIARGYRYAVINTNWYNRSHGISKFKIKELGSRYLFIIVNVLLERWLTGQDYKRQKQSRSCMTKVPCGK